MTDENTFHLLRTWEVTYRPFPALVEERGFDAILGQLADKMYAPDDADDAHPALRGWATALIGAQFDRQITISVDAMEGPPKPPDDSDYQPGIQGLGYSQEYTKEHYQRAVAAVIADLGLEGDLHVEEVVTVMRDPGLDEEETDDGLAG